MAPLTGSILLLQAESNGLKPTSGKFKEFIKSYVIEHHGFSNPIEDPSLTEQISEFMSDWPMRIRDLFKNKKYSSHLDRLLAGNHPKYLDREIRFVSRPPTPPQTPSSSGSFFVLRTNS